MAHLTRELFPATRRLPGMNISDSTDAVPQRNAVSPHPTGPVKEIPDVGYW